MKLDHSSLDRAYIMTKGDLNDDDDDDEDVDDNNDDDVKELDDERMELEGVSL